MRKSTLFFGLLGLAVVVLLVVLFSGALSGVSPAGNTPFTKLDKGAFDRIVIDSPTLANIVVEKRTGGWLVLEPVEYPADGYQIQAALALFTSIEKERVISNRANAWREYKVDDDDWQVRLYARGSLAGSLIIGKESPDGFGAYARIKGENQIFLVKQPLHQIFTSADTAWRDKTIFYFTVGNLRLVEYRRGSQRYKLTQVEEKQKDGAVKRVWYVDGKLAKQDVAAAMADNLARLTTNLFDDRKLKDNEYGFHVPVFSLRLEYKDGKTDALVVGNQDSSQYYYVRKGESGQQVFQVHPGAIERLNLPKSKLL